MADKDKLDLDDLEARPRDLGADEASEITGGYLTKTATKTTSTTTKSTYDPYAAKSTTLVSKTTTFPTKG